MFHASMIKVTYRNLSLTNNYCRCTPELNIKIQTYFCTQEFLFAIKKRLINSEQSSAKTPPTTLVLGCKIELSIKL